MKKHGTLNSHISKILADLGHTDTIVIADVGLPVPAGVLKIDLALKLGVPSFQDVVDMLAEDMVIEQIIVAKELASANEETSRYINNKFKEILIDEVSHEQFKLLTHNAKVIIRTGEAKPYANCILQAGVFFG
ncbi:D-ribose pyranase [Paenibacillus macquariensis]|uniref:D-ribose pyranase n=1 Tax=Paenibacillus macquariensis TaxID=948756 RepID=A0ABY1K7T2_9BACL|nr:D-ribose pyranase [Paenibacillus macquariensis]MEC0091134.1 D-ribose pyranase [Paenibacillus macquariensis]OAB33682.1 D-ribose pyranase [Paenibacillus macquariensis subsp. macquariensis]SIR37995.1 ribose transport protein RbsD [Paenibacillus macquariensis]